MRPEALYPLYADITALKGVGPKLAPLVRRVAGERVRDLLFLAPSGLLERHSRLIAEVQEGEWAIVRVRLDAHLPPQKPGQPYRIRVYDETGYGYLSWFKTYGDGLARSHPVGAERLASGRAERFNTELQIVHPDHLVAPGQAG